MPRKSERSLDLVKMENEKLLKDKEMEAKFAMINKGLSEEDEDVVQKKKEKKIKKKEQIPDPIPEPIPEPEAQSACPTSLGVVPCRTSRTEPIVKTNKKEPKVIEEVVEEEPEPIIVRKIIKKKAPKKVIEEVVEEEEEPEAQSACPTSLGVVPCRTSRTEPKKTIKKVVPRKRMDTMMEESSVEMLRKELENEMRRRLMTTLFDY